MNAIAKAVEPLRSSAIEAARASALKTVEKVRAELEAAGWDAQKAAPFPSSSFGREAYVTGKARYELFRLLTKRTDGCHSRRPGSPDPRAMDDARVAYFVKSMEDSASSSYEAFVDKLTIKVGEVTDAKLLCEGTWTYSVLEVTKPDGSIQRWKTQMIINVSVLGKLFNQWPTRMMK